MRSDTEVSRRPKVIAYVRCSTDEQADSRAGLDAQRAAIACAKCCGAGTESSQTFDNHDGTYSTVVSTGPEFYQPAAASDWQLIVLGFASPVGCRHSRYVLLDMILDTDPERERRIHAELRD